MPNSSYPRLSLSVLVRDEERHKKTNERHSLTGGVPLHFLVTPRTAPAVVILTRLAWHLVVQSLVIGLSSLRSNTICSMPRMVRCLQIWSQCTMAFATRNTWVFQSTQLRYSHHDDFVLHPYQKEMGFVTKFDWAYTMMVENVCRSSAMSVAEDTNSLVMSHFTIINFASTQVSVFPAAPGAEGTKFLFHSESVWRQVLTLRR